MPHPMFRLQPTCLSSGRSFLELPRLLPVQHVSSSTGHYPLSYLHNLTSLIPCRKYRKDRPAAGHSTAGEVSAGRVCIASLISKIELQLPPCLESQMLALCIFRPVLIRLPRGGPATRQTCKLREEPTETRGGQDHRPWRP